MLKLIKMVLEHKKYPPAAFRRLCVETWFRSCHKAPYIPAAFRRLCVETTNQKLAYRAYKPAAFRRLCVETFVGFRGWLCFRQPPSGGCVLKRFRGKTQTRTCRASRLQAAVC